MTPTIEPVRTAPAWMRWMIRRDFPQVLQIEQQSFSATWTEEDFLATLRERNCIGMVAEQPGTGLEYPPIGGFMVYELHKAELHVLNFAVLPAWRRCGIGGQMVAKLRGKLSSHRRTRITLEVRETNLPAQLFFRRQGFRAVRVLRGYYEDSREDAYVFEDEHSGD